MKKPKIQVFISDEANPKVKKEMTKALSQLAGVCERDGLDLRDVLDKAILGSTGWKVTRKDKSQTVFTKEVA